MRKKFAYDASNENVGDEDLRSRTDARRERRAVEDALARLSKDLIEMTDRKLQKLSLPELVLAAVVEARSMTSAPARNRQLRVVRSCLRAADWGAIKSRVDALIKHGVVPTTAAPPTEGPADSVGEWVVRLVGGGSEAIEALMALCPNVDRNHLRQLVRTVNKSSADRRVKAEDKLTQTVASLLRRG
jgi:ribosome-associated protein